MAFLISTYSIFELIAIFLLPVIFIVFYLKRTCIQQQITENVDNSINVWGLRITLIFITISIVLTFLFPQYFIFDWQSDVFNNIDNSFTYSFIIQIFGTILLYIGNFLLIWTLIYLGRMWTMLVSTVNNPQLITTGPYQFARHPMYSSISIYFMVFIIMLSNFTFAISIYRLYE